MRRVLLGISAFISSFTVVSAFAGGPELVPVVPDYFSGFFVGGTGAFHMTAFDGSSSTVSQDGVFGTATFPFIPSVGGPITVTELLAPAGTLTSNDVDGNAFDGYYGVQGGIGKVFNHRWYTGFVGFGEWGSQSSTSNSGANYQYQMVIPDRTPTPIVVNFNGNYTSSTTVKISNDFGVAFKPGFLVAPTSMVYGKIGAVWADLKISNSFSGNGAGTVSNPFFNVVQITTVGSYGGSSSSDYDQKIGLLLGVGFEQFIYKNFITLNIEYDYTNYGSVSTSTPVGGTGVISGEAGGDFSAPVTLTGATTQASADAKVSTLLGGLNFYFGSQWF